MKVAITAKKVVMLLMIGALAVAMVACQAGAPGEAGAPGAPAENPPQTVGTIMAQTVEAGQSLMMDVAKYFSEPESETLTYTATSSDDAIAMATATGSSVTVTGVKAGMADIMVTATDTDKLKVTQTFKVTVTAVDTTPEPEPDPETPADPDTITISDTNKVPVNLIDRLPDGADPADYVLESRDETVFTVGPKSTSMGPSKSVWEVKPISEGTAKAEIISKTDAMVVKTLTVVVQNRPPVPNPDAPVITKMTLMGPATHARPTGDTKEPLKNENGDDGLKLYYASLHVKAQFKDPDADDQLTYKITSSRDDVIVRDGGSCTLSPCKVWVDILKKRGNDDFALNVVAEDPDKATSTVTVMFPISMEYPAKQTYSVHQRTTGSFRSITVGDRAGDETEHTLVFNPLPVPEEDPVVNDFVFARRHLEILAARNGGTALTATQLTPGVPATTTGGTAKMFYINEPLPTDLAALRAREGAAALVPGTTSAYTVKTTGRVKVAPTKIGSVVPSLRLPNATAAPPIVDPDLVFTVSGVGPGTIEIGYHVWWDGPSGTTAQPMWHSVTETLAVTVMAVES